MNLQKAIEILEYHQKWRLGEKEDMENTPEEITEATDKVIEIAKKFYKKGKLQYKDNQSARDVAKKYQVTVGEIACRECGCVVHGALTEDSCVWCGTKFFETYMTQEEKDIESFIGSIEKKRYDDKYAPPFRVGRKQGNAVLDSKGIQVVFFNNSEEQAQLYCDYLNNKL